MKWPVKRWLKKLALAAGIFLAVVVLFFFAIHVRSKSSVDEYKQRLRAAGEKLTIAELMPPPPPPAESNSAALMFEAKKLAEFSNDFVDANPLGSMLMIIPGRAAIAWQQPDIRNSDATNTWAAADIVMEQRAGQFELYQKTLQQPKFVFEINYQAGWADLTLLHLAPMKGSARVLADGVVYDLHRSNVPAAVTKLHTLLTIAKNWDEPFLISQLVRFSMIQIGTVAQWQLLQAPELADDQLALLQRDWAGLELVQPMERALQLERAMGDQAMLRAMEIGDPQAIAGSMPGPSSGPSGNVLEDLGQLWKGAKRRTAVTMWKVSWSYADQFRALQGYQVLIEAARQIKTNGFFKDALAGVDPKLRAVGYHSPKANLELLWDKLDEDGVRQIFSGSVAGMEKSLSRVLTAETAKELAITAIALKRYQLRHGEFPVALSNLVPEILPSLPRDLVDGQSLRYRRNSDGTYLLYSVGENGRDDGGDPSSSSSSFYWQRGHDWVWPQPAALLEVQAYYATNFNSLRADQRRTIEYFIEQMSTKSGAGTNAVK